MMGKWAIVVFLLCCLAVIPFIGTYDYNTKGEPREAIVALNMLESGNWVAPRNSVGEIAYKPPLFHWTIAATALATGKVDEWSSRFPSALTFILLTAGCFCFFRRRTDIHTALLTTVIVFTAYELHRMGFNCRVDMLLTLFIVAAMFLLYRWHERGMKGIPWTAILMMSLGTLTKGPIGALLPCLVTGVYLLLQRVHWLKATAWMAAVGALSLLLPACWYLAAYRQAGDEFIRLMMEENVGRMTNSMAYKVHVEPWYMNLLYLLMGMAPWTLLALLSMGKIKWQRPRHVQPLTCYAITAVGVTTLFFTIPECKRSVYLMPVYPFLALLTARYILWVAKAKPRRIDIYASVLSMIGITVGVAMISLRFIPLPDSLFQGRNGYDTREMATNLATLDDIMAWGVLLLTMGVCAAWWHWRQHHRSGHGALHATMVMTLLLYLTFDAALKPAILDAKSLKHVAAKIDQLAPSTQGQLYEYIEQGVQAKGDPIHYYELNFYLGDRIDNFHIKKPESGFLLIGDADFRLREAEFRSEGYQFEQLYTSSPEPILKQSLHLYRFWK